MDPVEEVSPEETPEQKDGSQDDVFSFLVDDGSKNPAIDSTTDEPEPDDGDAEHEPEPEPVPYPNEGTHEVDFSTRSFHSDSGVSMDDGSFILGKAVMQPLLASDVDQQGPAGRHTEWRYPQVPKPQHKPFIPHEAGPVEDEAEDPSDRFNRPPGDTPSPASVFTENDTTFPLSSDHLASELADLDSPPLFKAFKKSNYRILLQLQDEIIELEEELAELDTYDGSRRLNKDASTGETLRRLSFHWGQCPFDLYKAKADVLGRLQIRMDQYYKTLSLSQKVHGLRISQRCNPDNVERFRQNLENHFKHSAPSSSNPDEEYQPHFSFLDDESDLVSVQSLSGELLSAGGPLLSPMSLVPLIIPLLLFKVFTGVINRLLIVVITLALCVVGSRQHSIAEWLGNIDGDHRNMHKGLIASACVSVLVGLLF